MREIYRHREISLVSLRQQALEEQGIQTMLRNEFFEGGGIAEQHPNLCVMNDGDYEKALHILKSMEAKP